MLAPISMSTNWDATTTLLLDPMIVPIVNHNTIWPMALVFWDLVSLWDVKLWLLALMIAQFAPLDIGILMLEEISYVFQLLLTVIYLLVPMLLPMLILHYRLLLVLNVKIITYWLLMVSDAVQWLLQFRTVILIILTTIVNNVLMDS